MTTSKARENFGAKNNEFCCLGVLCNLHAQAHPEFAATQTDPKKYDGDCALAPYIVTEWSGLKHEAGVYSNVIFASSLSELNDTGKTFAEITDIIEKNWKKL